MWLVVCSSPAPDPQLGNQSCQWAQTTTSTLTSQGPGRQPTKTENTTAASWPQPHPATAQALAGSACPPPPLRGWNGVHLSLFLNPKGQRRLLCEWGAWTSPQLAVTGAPLAQLGVARGQMDTRTPPPGTSTHPQSVEPGRLLPPGGFKAPARFSNSVNTQVSAKNTCHAKKEDLKVNEKDDQKMPTLI